MSNYFVYVIQSVRDDWIYVGYTTDFKKRITRHNLGHVTSTKIHRPFRMLFLEIYINKADAKRREKYLKTTKGKQTLKTMLIQTLNSAN